jgi:hypothetical protein
VLMLCRADDPPDADLPVPGQLRRLDKPVSTRALLQAVRDALRAGGTERFKGDLI